MVVGACPVGGRGRQVSKGSRVRLLHSSGARCPYRLGEGIMGQDDIAGTSFLSRRRIGVLRQARGKVTGRIVLDHLDRPPTNLLASIEGAEHFASQKHK